MQFADIQKVLSGDEEGEFFEVYNDARFVAVLENEPWTKGHTIIIPKKQFESLSVMPPQFRDSMMKTAKKITEILKEKLRARSFHIMINEGDLLDPNCYLCTHIIPRFNKRELNIEHKQHNDRLDKIYSLIIH